MRKILDNLLKNNILRSSTGLLAITLLVKVIGYAEKLILANYFGTSYQVDVYTVVLTIILSIFFFFREIVEPGFLNVFIDARNKGNESVSWDLFNKGLRLILLTTILISIITFFFPVSFIRIFAPGFENEKLELSKTLVKIAIPAGIFLAMSTLTSITLNGMKIFVLPASGELVFKGSIILFMVILYKEHGIIGATIGILIGSIGRIGVHLTKLYKKIKFKKIKIENKYKHRIWLLTWPLLIGVSFSQLSNLVDNIFASYLQEGAIAALSYAKKVVELPVILFPYVISIVIFPYFAELSIEKEREKLINLLSSSLKWITISFLPIATFFVIFSTPIVEIIFQRGAFDTHSTILTSKPLAIYSLGMLFFAIETILIIFYYANADTKTPVFVGIACVILNIILTWYFIHIIGYIGIALAFVIQKILKNLILLLLVKQKINYNKKILWSFLTKLFISFIPFSSIILLVKILIYNNYDQNLIGKMSIMALGFIIAGTVYIIILNKFGITKIKNSSLV